MTTWSTATTARSRWARAGGRAVSGRARSREAYGTWRSSKSTTTEARATSSARGSRRNWKRTRCSTGKRSRAKRTSNARVVYAPGDEEEEARERAASSASSASASSTHSEREGRSPSRRQSREGFGETHSAARSGCIGAGVTPTANAQRGARDAVPSSARRARQRTAYQPCERRSRLENSWKYTPTASVDDARGADAGEADAIVARSRAKGGRRAASVSPRAGRPRAPPTAELTTTKRRACRGIGRISDSDLIRVGSGKINSSIDGYARTQRSALIGGEQIPCPV